MSFEVREQDLLGRIGRLKSKTNVTETPALLPVVNPSIQPVAPKVLNEKFGFKALITNAYIIKHRFGTEPVSKGLHKFLSFDGTIMTDSGAYQTLVYGAEKTTQEEIVRYQEQIDTDIATILDIPTGWKITEADAAETVKATLKRAKQLRAQKTRKDILWVGPVQGGRYSNLVAKSALEMGKLPFDLHALGSPTEVMERYRFDVLTEMILTAKARLPINKPFHLFGAGHPFMFSLAVALGCDLFDSAAYALYAKENRYMTDEGTCRLDELEYLPCACPRCQGSTPKAVSEMLRPERTTFLTEHNLYVCASELRHIKQAMKDGRLWEHMQMRAHSHPSLMQALKRLSQYKDELERHSPAFKASGIFFYSSVDLPRPEIVRHAKRLERVNVSHETKFLVLIPQTQTRPFHNSREFKSIVKSFGRTLNEKPKKTQFCFYAAPFGIVPLELDEVYPLSQHEIALPLDIETQKHVATQITDYIRKNRFDEILFVTDFENWGQNSLKAVKKACNDLHIQFRQESLRTVSGQSATQK